MRLKTSRFFYNTDLVETPPATWDEVRTMSKEIIDSGEAQYGWIRQEGDPYHFFPIQTAFGGYIFGLDEEGQLHRRGCRCGQRRFSGALQFVQGMLNDGLIPSGLDGNAAQKPCSSDGEAAMYITGPWNIQASIDAGLNFAIAPMPGWPGW